MASEGASQTPWRSLHPASLVVNLIPQAWRVARGMWPLLLIIVIQGRSAPGLGANLLALLVFLGLSVSNTVLHFLTLRYRVHEGRLQIRSGLLMRRDRSLDPARIQNISLQQNLFHKAAGLVELHIETAADASTDGLLSALSVGEARALKDALEQARGGGTEAPAPDAPPRLEVSALELVAFGLSQRRMGAVALFFAAGSEIFGMLAPDRAARAMGELGPKVLVGGLLLAFAASWALSAGTALWRHWRFRLLAEPSRLVTVEGLTTVRRVEIPLHKVQVVHADEPWMRRVMGYGTVNIETAAIRLGEGELRQAEAQIPMVPVEDLGALARQVLPALGLDPWAARLRPAAPAAVLRASLRGLLRGLIYSVVAIFLTWTLLGWTALLWPLLAPLAVPLAWGEARRQGWLLTPEAVVSRRGLFRRQTWLVARTKVQSVHVAESPLDRLAGLARVIVRVAGTAVVLPDLVRAEALEVADRLRQGARSEQQLDGDDAADDPEQVADQARGDRVARAEHADAAEVDGQHVEGGL